MTLSANRNVDRFIDNELRSLKVLATTHIYKGALLGFSSGYVRPLVAGDEFAGVAYEEVNNTGSSGDKSVRVFPDAYFSHALVGADEAHNKSAVYASADDTLTYTPTANSFVGWQVCLLAANTILVHAKAEPPITTPLARTYIAQQDDQPYNIPLSDMRVTGTLAVLGNSAGTPSGAFGITPGSHGTNSPKLIGEAANANSKTNKCRFFFGLPAEYVANQSVTVRVHARITGNVAVSQTIDVTAYKSNGEAGVSADLCATAAQTLTSSFADYDFVITSTGLAAGDMLDIELTGVADDTGGTANKLIEIGSVEVLLDVKG